MSSDTDTGPSDGEGNDDEDVSYGVGQPPAFPMEVDPPPPEGEPSGERAKRGVARRVRDASGFGSCASGCNLSGFSRVRR